MFAERPRRRLVVVPSDPISAYEDKGRGALLRDYYNPGGYFDEVIALSPREQGEREAHGMRIVGVPERDFRRALARIGPSLVRAYGGYWAADLCCRERLPGVPVVVSVHDPNPVLMRPAIRYADRVLCTSAHVSERVAALGVHPSRIRLLPNRVDLGVFAPVSDPGPVVARIGTFPPGRPVLFVGRASPEKNRDTVIRALARLPDDYFGVFVGRGDLDGDRELARREGVLTRCHFVESVANEDLPALYTWAACLCNPSRWEGFGIVFIEAAACGAAIVTSDQPPMSEFFDPDQACLLKAFEDPAAIAAAITRVCEDDVLRSRLKARVRRAAEPFASERVATQEIAIYQELLVTEPADLGRRLQLLAWRAWNVAPLRRLRGGLRRRYGAMVGTSAPLTSTREGASTRT